ncbi:MAG TPA: FHA domain-containing protein [Sandaracinaceae bacterium]
MGVRLHVRSLWGPRDSDEVVYEFDQDRILIGRGRGADVCLPHRAVSVRHASIELRGARYVLVDHGSTNGTRVVDAAVVPGREKPLRDGDRIELGGFVIVFRAGVAVTSPTSSERTASLARRLARGALGPGEALPGPSLAILNGPNAGERVPLPDPPARFVIGRGEHCELSLADADVSREHAELEIGADGVRVRDLGSKNGILVGGRPVRERLLGDGDELRVGATVLRFDDPAAERVRALEEGEDEVVEAPVLADVEPEPDESPPTAPEEPPAPPRPRPKASVAPADLVIYVLAATVFALSVLGLVWLLRAG